MRYNVIGYLIGEGLRNVFKNKKSTIASLMIMCATMFVFGIFFLLGENVQAVVKQVEEQQAMQVFIEPEATEQEMYEALDISQAREFVDTKQGGLEFQIEQGGRNLSGGQKQRMTIARALVRKPEILILDDSASALDFATDAALRKSIKEMKNQPTVFIVSQRAASIQHADQIIVLDDGAMAGIGTHEELLKDCPIYQEIYYSQFPKEAVING